MTSAQRRPDPRRQALTDLADAINELVRDRRHTEYLTERYSVERPGRKTTSRQRRRAVTTTLPPLLRALAAAAMPGAVTDDTGPGGGGAPGRRDRLLPRRRPVHGAGSTAGRGGADRCP